MLAACCKIVRSTDQENSAAYKAEPIRIRQISEYDLLNCQAMGTRGQESKGTSLKLLHIVAKKALKRLFKSCRLPCKYLSCPIYRGTWLSIAPLPYWVRADRQIFYDSSSKICVISLSTSRSFSTRACRSFSSCASSPRRASNFGDSEWGAAFGGWTVSAAACADSAAAFNWPARLRLAVSAC